VGVAELENIRLFSKPSNLQPIHCVMSCRISQNREGNCIFKFYMAYDAIHVYRRVLKLKYCLLYAPINTAQRLETATNSSAPKNGNAFNKNLDL
jgi:hypothetical protein